MADAQKLGPNKTGMAVHPSHAARMLERHAKSESRNGVPPPSYEKYHLKLIEEAGAVGAVPIPTSVKGMAKAGIKKLAGKHQEVFLDKLGERLAFERSGVRLYDALIGKYKAQRVDGITLRELEKIRDEELDHFRMLQDAIEELGADPTSVTPSADLVGVMGSGLVQVCGDPRNDFAVCLNAILVAELTDNDAWENLIELAKSFGQEDLVADFTKALKEETEHLVKVRGWIKQLTKNKAGA